MSTVSHVETRYYGEPPQRKSVEQCRQHGRDHGAYNWAPQVDPRWTEAQIAAYRAGYAEGKANRDEA